MRKICKLKDYIAVFSAVAAWGKLQGRSEKKERFMMFFTSRLHDDDDAMAGVSMFMAMNRGN